MYPTIKFGNIEKKPDVRMVADLKPVLMTPIDENFPAYYMYRDLYKNEEEGEIIRKFDLRYDITVIPPAKIGIEFIKTFGHYHPKKNKVSYPEIYEVLEGEAIFLLQKRGARDSEIVDVLAVYAKDGDKVIIPPDYGHVTINPSDKTLKMANWVCRSFSSIYDPFSKLRGACYYYTEKGWIKNENYKSPNIRIVKPIIPDWLGISKKESMYSLIENLENLEFLVNPECVEYDVFEEV